MLEIFQLPLFFFAFVLTPLFLFLAMEQKRWISQINENLTKNGITYKTRSKDPLGFKWQYLMERYSSVEFDILRDKYNQTTKKLEAAIVVLMTTLISHLLIVVVAGLAGKLWMGWFVSVLVPCTYSLLGIVKILQIYSGIRMRVRKQQVIQLTPPNNLPHILNVFHPETGHCSIHRIYRFCSLQIARVDTTSLNIKYSLCFWYQFRKKMNAAIQILMVISLLLIMIVLSKIILV